MRERIPVIFDVTQPATSCRWRRRRRRWTRAVHHAAGVSRCGCGYRRTVPRSARRALARAKSDAQNVLRLDLLEPLLRRLLAIDQIVKQPAPQTTSSAGGAQQRGRSGACSQGARNRGCRHPSRWCHASTGSSLAPSTRCKTAGAASSLTGMGKSGIICRKIAATLTSTGTVTLSASGGSRAATLASFRVNVVVALSSSGETARSLRLLETISTRWREEADCDCRQAGVHTRRCRRHHARLQR